MKSINRFSIVMSILMLCLIAGNIFMFADMSAAIETGAAIPHWMSVTVAISLIMIGLLHLLGLFTLIRHFRYFKNDCILRAATFVLGFLSLFLLAADVMMLSDIGHEYLTSHDVSGEWQMVFAGHAIHALFTVLLLIQCATVGKQLSKDSKPTAAVKDEALFLTVNQIGIISALLGFICSFLLSRTQVPQSYQTGLLFMLCLVLLFPYGLAAAYWFFTKRKEKPSEWYDEKQFADVSRGALITLTLTVLLTIVVYFLSSVKAVNIDLMYWFPVNLFLTLLLFSASTLYLSKKA